MHSVKEQEHWHICPDCSQGWGCVKSLCFDFTSLQCPECSKERVIDRLERHFEGPVLKGPAIVSTVLIVLTAIGEWPYGYYLFLRLIVCLSSVYLALHAAKKMKLGWAWPMVSIAVLFSIALPFHTPKSGWPFFGLFVVPLFLGSLLVFRKAEQADYLMYTGGISGFILSGVVLGFLGPLVNALLLLFTLRIAWWRGAFMIFSVPFFLLLPLILDKLNDFFVLDHEWYRLPHYEGFFTVAVLFSGLVLFLNVHEQLDGKSVLWPSITWLVNRIASGERSKTL